MCSYLAKKYSFLYTGASFSRFDCVQVNVLHKIDAAYKHNYPLLNNGNSSSSSSNMNNTMDSFAAAHPHASSTPIRAPRYQQQQQQQQQQSVGNSMMNPPAAPFRTCSHYGFNYPLANTPSILLHPANQSIWQTVAEQRERVVSFIDLTSLSFAKRKMLNVLSASAGKRLAAEAETEPETEPEPELEPEAEGEAGISAPSYVSEMQIQLMASSPSSPAPAPSANDSLEELTAQFSSMLSLRKTHNSPQQQQQQQQDRDDDSLYPSNYTVRSFLPDNHALPKDGAATADKPEAEQAIYLNGVDSGLGDSHINSNNHNHNGNHNSSSSNGRRVRRGTTSNDSSIQEAEAYSQGKHIRLTLSSSPEAQSQLKSSSIEIVINVSLRDTECVQTVQAHEHEFRTKLEKVIDDEIHYISQQLAMQQRHTHLEQQPRAALATPTPSTAMAQVQRCNSAPALCHTYSYVALGDSDSSAPRASPMPSSSNGHSCPEADALQRLLSTLELELQHLLNSIIRAHELHNRAVIYDCRTRISQMRDDIKGVVKRTRAK